ncbi:hypothetical protein HID58_069067 [Brassica napus]|uniref:Potassium channel n=1 Tax=Brassica napus TaxID=3708 RepID=A0ABQ7ZN90_BRANA|nr:hypothetical protein HID58_069067 [Brassica napus]
MGGSSGGGVSYRSDVDSDVELEDYEVDDDFGEEGIVESGGNRFNPLTNFLGLDFTGGNGGKFTVINGIRDISRGSVVHPDSGCYKAWTMFIVIWALYSSFFTPLEFGFFRGLPGNLFILDILGQIAFLVDIVLTFFVAYRDSRTYRMVYRRSSIALRYLKSTFIIDFLSCMPWDIIYKVAGRKEEVRYLLLIRLYRVRRVILFFHKMEKDIRINYLFTRIVKLIFVELYCTHTAACIFYYLATTLPASQEGYTWIGSLKLGDYSYAKFREIDLWTRYTTSMYFAVVTMATVGYGDIHAVNMREMIFAMAYISFDMILGAYLIGNMTALIVKGSKTERFRDKMADIMRYMNRNKLGRNIRGQITGHLRLQYESSYTEAAVLQDIPVSIRAKIAQTLYLSYIEKVPLFLIMEQGSVVDQLYFVCHGVLEEIGTAKDGSEEIVSLLQPDNSFGEISILCNIPQPYTVRVSELCRILRLDKQSFMNILEIYFHDGRRILNNLLEGKESNGRIKQLESDITFHISKQEAELALKLNSAAFYGDLYQLKSLIRAGADPNKTDYDGRSPLHLAASRGYEDITLYLIQESVDVNIKDKLGNTPLLEAIKNGNDRVATLLVKEGATLSIENAGTFLCTVVAKGDSDFLKRLLNNGIDPNSKDYDQRTPLHVASSEGLYLLARQLVEADAKTSQMSSFLNSSKEIKDKVYKKKCTVYSSHPNDSKEKRRRGIVLWVPRSIEELVRTAAEQLNFPEASCVLSEDEGKIIDVELISDGQKLYLTIET